MENEIPQPLAREMKSEGIDHVSVDFRSHEIERVEGYNHGTPAAMSRSLTNGITEYATQRIEPLSASAGTLEIDRKSRAVEVDFSRGMSEKPPAGHPPKVMSDILNDMAKAYNNEQRRTKGKEKDRGRER